MAPASSPSGPTANHRPPLSAQPCAPCASRPGGENGFPPHAPVSPGATSHAIASSNSASSRAVSSGPPWRTSISSRSAIGPRYGVPPRRRGCTAMLERMTDGSVVVIDGGMGTELEARGAPMDHEAWCGLANLTAPDLVREIHEDYIRAGADVIIANTFPANRAALDVDGDGDRVEEMNRAAVAAALAARERAAGGREVAVAGSMSIWGPWEGAAGDDLPSDAVLLDVYREQAGILADAGVDLIVLEMLDVRWAPALTAARETGLPVWAGLWAHL